MTIKESSEELEKHIVPILGAKNKLIVFVGTGFIYRLNDRLYLVSASHVFDELKASASGINIGISPKIINIKQSGTFRTTGESGTGRDCDVDVMACPIGEDNEYYDLIKNISVNNDWACEPNLSGMKGRMLLQGFPSSKNKQSKTLNQTTNMLEVVSSSFTTTSKEIEYEKFGKTEQNHIALDIPKKDSSGQVFHSLTGMSGCPLWLISESDPRPFLMGVFTEYKNEYELGFATKLYCVDNLIMAF